ncbi:MAG TPA: PDDEXK nuclease domain-containing protein [Oculatellaceae cyanobacterium]
MANKDVTDVLKHYEPFLEELKDSIRQAQVRAALSVNRELILLYWRIGKAILEQQAQQGWGAKVVDRLGQDLRITFPEMKGLSARNLKYMRAFAEAYPELEIVQAAPAQITWYHNCTLLDKIKEPEIRRWYAEQTVLNGWSRDVLVHQIETGLHKRLGQAVTNFEATLPKPQSELAQQILKDPYHFDFLELSAKAIERDLEKSLLNKLRDFLLELGTGFAFVGSQYHLVVGGQDYYLDLLFYHLKARCFVAVDLKITDFQPEYVGKMGFYLSAVDDLVRHPEDRPSIGLILCKTKNNVIAEYALRNTQAPMGVSEYKVAQPLPKEIGESLPTIEQLQEKLQDAPFFADVSFVDIPPLHKQD